MDNTKKRILKATVELFFEKGVENVTMRDIAERSRISPGNLTYYFRKKEELFAVAFENLLLREHSRIAKLCGDHDYNPWESFIAASYAHLAAVANTDSALNGFIYATSYPSSRLSYIAVSANLLFRCLENTRYQRDRESVWLASMIGCGGEFEALSAYGVSKGKYALEELAAPCFSARMFLLGLQEPEISAFISKGIESGKAVDPRQYGAD
jgi:AcrR family transcriptional regulator